MHSNYPTSCRSHVLLPFSWDFSVALQVFLQMYFWPDWSSNQAMGCIEVSADKSTFLSPRTKYSRLIKTRYCWLIIVTFWVVIPHQRWLWLVDPLESHEDFHLLLHLWSLHLDFPCSDSIPVLLVSKHKYYEWLAYVIWQGRQIIYCSRARHATEISLTFS